MEKEIIIKETTTEDGGKSTQFHVKGFDHIELIGILTHYKNLVEYDSIQETLGMRNENCEKVINPEDVKICDIDEFNVRILNAIASVIDIDKPLSECTLKDLSRINIRNLRSLRNFGETSLDVIINVLNKHNLKLAGYGRKR